MKNAIRLVYLSVEKFKDKYGFTMIGHSMGLGKWFKIPEGMDENQAYKVASYILESVAENKENLFTYENMEKVNEKLKQMNFVEIDDYWSGCISGSALAASGSIEFPMSYRQFINKGGSSNNLLFIGGDKELFKWSVLKEKQFEWFEKGITKEQIEEIYKNVKIQKQEETTK